MANSGSVGGRRGAHQTGEMTLSKAKSLQGKKGSKPNLDKAGANMQSKVTNKPSMSGKRMK